MAGEVPRREESPNSTRAVRRVTPGQGDLTDQWHRKHTARLRAFRALRRAGLPGLARRSPKGRRRVRVKRCGKSAPRSWQHEWQAKPRTEQDQIGWRRHPGAALVARGTARRTARPKPPGRSLESASDRGPRGMVVPPSRALRASARQARKARRAVARQGEGGNRIRLTGRLRRFSVQSLESCSREPSSC